MLEIKIDQREFKLKFKQGILKNYCQERYESFFRIHSKLLDAFELDSRYLVAALIPLGYSDQNPDQRPGLSVDEIRLKII